jgi:hypothetical protein
MTHYSLTHSLTHKYSPLVTISLSLSSPLSPDVSIMSDNSWGSWFEQKSQQAKTLASQAHVAASEVSRKYELDKHASSLISGISEISTVATETLKEAQKDAIAKQMKPVNVEQLDFTYVTENIVAMAFPFEPSKRKVKGGNDINLVSRYMAEKHAGKFMIWNISEDAYDYTKFDDQVLGKVFCVSVKQCDGLT